MRYLKENLLVQFSVVSFVIMAVIAVVLAIVLSNKIRSDAIDDVVDEAIGSALGRVLSEITPADLEVPMTGARYDRFHEFVQRSIVSERIARVKIWTRDGTVIYSNDPTGVGEKFPAYENLLKALHGENVTEIKVPEEPEHAHEKHLGTLMEVYTPIIFPDSTEPQGALEIYQYYGPTAQRIDSLRGWVFGSIGIGFVVLYGGLVSIVWGGWRTINRQQAALARTNVEVRTANEQLHQAQERLALILNSAGEGIYGLDSQGKTTFVNPAAARLIGGKVEEFVGQPQGEILHHAKPDGTPYPWEEYPTYATLKEGTIHRVDDELFWRKDGTSFPVEYTSTPIKENGRIVGAVVTFRDVTERKQAEEELHRQNEYLASLHETTLAVMNRLELTDLLQSLVARAAALMDTQHGYITLLDPDESVMVTQVGVGIFSQRIGDRLKPNRGVAGKVWQTGQSLAIDDYQTLPDRVPGSNLDILHGLVGVPLKSGARVVGVIGLARTEAKHPFKEEEIALLTQFAELASVALDNARLYTAAQQELVERKRTEETLRQNEERFRQVVTSITHHVYMTEFTKDGEQINHYLSPNIEPLTGYPLEKFMADWSFWPSKVIHPDDREAAAAQAARLAQGQSSEVEYRLVRADGDIIWVRDSGRVEKDTARQSLLVYGVVSDITERKQAEEELTRAHNQALEASRLKTQLLANVSHDLRTPLNAILGYTEMLQEGVYDPLTDQQRRATTEIIDSTGQLLNFINNLLDQAEIESGKVVFNITSFTPTELLDDAQSTLDVLIRAKGLTLTREIAPDVPPTLSGDPYWLRQILANLMNNAIKFTEQGSVHLHILRPDAGHWAFQVSDTGRGIPAEARSYIFDAFRQVDGSTTRGHPGSGLGLSIVKQLTTMMGGQITLTSEVGQGSTFTVSLPLVPIQEKTV